MNGWIKLHRKIMNNWIWEDPVKLKWWIDLLLMCNHDYRQFNFGMEVIECKSGQLVTSLQSLSARWKVSRDTVRHFLNLAEKAHMISLKKRTKYTQITICNYDHYQHSAHGDRQKTDTKPTDNRHKQERKEFKEINNRVQIKFETQKNEIDLEETMARHIYNF